MDSSSIILKRDEKYAVLLMKKWRSGRKKRGEEIGLGVGPRRKLRRNLTKGLKLIAGNSTFVF